MSEEMIKVYGAPWCPDCRRSKQFLGEMRVPYEWIDIDEEPAAARIAQQRPRPEAGPSGEGRFWVCGFSAVPAVPLLPLPFLAVSTLGARCVDVRGKATDRSAHGASESCQRAAEQHHG